MSNYNQAQAISAELQASDDAEKTYTTDNDWLTLARDSFRTSTDYIDFSLKKQWEKNMAHFHSKHAPGSKYYTDQYRYRSKLFRPKTRSIERQHEAAAAAAYFATNDAVHIAPEDDSDPGQVISAEINMELVNYRLEHSIPWFLTLVGAYQETMNIGVVVSYQHWLYKERKTKKPTGIKFLDETGQMQEQFKEVIEVLEDRPVIDLRPIENIRIDPASDWTDPINSSPYLIDMIPMYVTDIKERMSDNGGRGDAKWRKLTDAQIMSASKFEHDSLRKQREGGDRQDPKDVSGNTHEYQLCWVHRNFFRMNGEEVMFYTLGTDFMLSDPRPIREVYQRKTRPYVLGRCIIEAHRTYSSSASELGEQLQIEANEIANARIDNVKLAINKRHYIRRGADIDFTALMRSAPGSGILMDDPNGDVKAENVTDVTSSSYAEQDRINNDFDEVMGGFSQGSVASNRAINETVGGMELLSNSANKIEEYQLRTFNETWVEPVLNQVLDMEREFESDNLVINIAGRKSKAAKQAGIKNFDWRMLQGPARLKVSVGFGSTNPAKRIEKLSIALGTTLKFLPHMAHEIDADQVIGEIFGAIGSDGSRFFKGLKDGNAQDPQVKALQQQVQQLQRIIETKQVEQQGKIQIEQIRQQGKERIESIKSRLAYIDKQLEAEKNELARGELLLEQSALVHQQRVTEIQLLQAERGQVMSQIEQQAAAKTGMDDSGAGVIARNNYGQVPFAEG